MRQGLSDGAVSSLGGVGLSYECMIEGNASVQRIGVVGGVEWEGGSSE